MNKVILHIDMDAFFAAIEQVDFPEYRGKPVIVGADPQNGSGRGVVSTCSYEARKFGIHSAMPISQAYKRCPHGIYLRGRMQRYQEISRNIMKIFYTFSSTVEPLSIDEAFLDITGSIKLLGPPSKIAIDIKNRVKQELKLTASVGIAPCKFVAKIASDLKKPNGLVIVKPENVKIFLQPLPISKMWGVGKKTEPIMIKLGIRTIGDLAAFSRDKIVKLMGKGGLQFWNLANGIDNREVIPHGDAKSVSQETTFAEDTNDVKKMTETLFYLCTGLGSILRKEKIKGKTVTLKIRLNDFTTFTRSRSSNNFLDTSKDIFGIIYELFEKFDREGKKVRLLGVAVSNLCNRIGEQISIFDKIEDTKKSADYVIDMIQEKFGIDAIKRASLMHKNTHRLSDQKLKSSENPLSE